MLNFFVRLRGKPELGRQQLRHVGQRVRLGPRPLLRLHPLQPGRQEHRVPAARPLRQVDGNDGYPGGCGVVMVTMMPGRASTQHTWSPTRRPQACSATWARSTPPCSTIRPSTRYIFRYISSGGKFSVVSHIMISAANRLISEVVQTRRRPLLGPSPG